MPKYSSKRNKVRPIRNAEKKKKKKFQQINGNKIKLWTHIERTAKETDIWT